MRYLKNIILLVFFALSLPAIAQDSLTANVVPDSKAESAKTSGMSSRRKSVKATGERGRRLEELRKQGRGKSSKYRRWKRTRPFWLRKAIILGELSIMIALGILFAQILELSGLMRYLSILAWPITRVGGINRETAPAFLMAFQSGAVANTMLVSWQNNGKIDRRQLYTSVLIVSCLSLFAHLPTYIIPIGSVFGVQATAALFGVRFAAIIIEIILILVVSSLVIQPWLLIRGGVVNTPIAGEGLNRKERKKKGALSFWSKVWKRSHRTMLRLCLYLIPAFVIMSTLEYFGAFEWMSKEMPGLFQWSFLPPQASAIIPAQAISLYSGAILAANCVDDGGITIRQAVFVILTGSVITAPIRTLKHALPTYVAVLGFRDGLLLAISAQVLRVIFLIICMVALWFLWPA